jgi:hypothetical protein
MPSVAKGSPEPERGGERFVAKGVARVLDELASPFVAKQRRAPDEGADKRDRQLARLILRTASPVNDATSPKDLSGLRTRNRESARAVASGDFGFMLGGRKPRPPTGR